MTKKKVTGRKKTTKSKGVQDGMVKFGEEMIFDEQPAVVHVDMGATVAQAGYENTKINIGITIPCRPENVHKVYQNIRNEVEKLLVKEIKQLRQNGGVA